MNKASSLSELWCDMCIQEVHPKMLTGLYPNNEAFRCERCGRVAGSVALVLPPDKEGLADEFAERVRRGYPSGPMNPSLAMRHRALHSYDVVAYAHPGYVLCPECHPWDSEDCPEAPDECAPVFADSEWDYYPTCDKCGMVIDEVMLTAEGRKYEGVDE